MDRGSLAGYNPWGHKESDTTEQLYLRVYLLFMFYIYSYVPSSSLYF